MLLTCLAKQFKILFSKSSRKLFQVSLINWCKNLKSMSKSPKNHLLNTLGFNAMAVELTQFLAFATNVQSAKTLTTAPNVKIILVTSIPSLRLGNLMAHLQSLLLCWTNRKRLNKQSRLSNPEALNMVLAIMVITATTDMDIKEANSLKKWSVASWKN